MADPQAEESKKQILFTGQYIRLMSDEGWEYAERVGATGVVAIVPIAEDVLILTEQYRKPVDARVIDLPAGLAGDLPDGPTEALVTAAQRELMEETGFRAANLKFLTAGPTSAGSSTEIVTLFLGIGLSPIGPGGGDDSEDIIVHEIPLASINEWLEQKSQSGLQIDPKIYAGLYFVQR